MDRLPQELTAIIISHLPDDKQTSPPRSLAPYATVSSKWQQPVEAMTFAHVTLTPARLASPLAAQALTAGRVRRFVRRVDVDVLLPPYGEEARGRRENDEEKDACNAMFTYVVRKVFALLSLPAEDARGSGDHSGGYRPRIWLSMEAHCLSDQEDMKTRWDRQDSGLASTEDIFGERYEGSYLDLRPVAGNSVQEEAEALPDLPCISTFQVFAGPFCQCRYFAPRALCLIASRMSGLEVIHWNLCDNEKRDVHLRQDLRADFANTLHALPNTLVTFHLEYDRYSPLDYSFETPSVPDETDQDEDKLSLALYKLSKRLTAFSLEAFVGPEIFGPPEPEPEQQQQQDDNPSHWPNMCWYTISPRPIGPLERWSYKRKWTDDEKVDPEPDAVGPLLLAAARAAARMPELESMDLDTRACSRYVGWDGLSIRYIPGVDGESGLPVSNAAVLLVDSHPEFHPDEEVLEAWRETAREHVGAKSGLRVRIEDRLLDS